MTRPYNRDGEQAARNRLVPVEIGGENYEFKYEPRCRVCNGGTELVALVNKLLINGESYSGAYRFALQFDDRKKPITFNSVYKHGKAHMPSTSAVVRKTIERRSQRLGQDFVEGTDNLVSEVVYAEVMMRKAFELMNRPDAEISARDGLEAAKTLRTFTAEEDAGGSLAGVLMQLNQIIEAVRAVVPPMMWREIVSRLDETDRPSLTAVPSEVVGDDDEAFDPASGAEWEADEDL